MKSELKVKINEITEDGYELEDYLDAASLGLDESDPGRYITPVKVKGILYRRRDCVVANLTGSSRYATLCYRSLEPVEMEISVDMTCDFKISANQLTLDLADEIRQEMILHVPLRVLSKSEMAKDARGEPAPFPTVDDENLEPESELDTYRPFEGLDLNSDDNFERDG